MANPEDPSALPSPDKARRARTNHGRSTLADVASHAGVTTMTVSRYLRSPAAVAASTGEKIATALDVTGYTPNKQAGLLASGRSHMVATIVPSIAHSIFAETLQGLEDGLQPLGLQLLLASSGYSIEREEAHLRSVLGWAPAALVVTGRHHTPASLAMMRRAQVLGTPVLEMWDHHDTAEFTQIGFNHSAAGALMARYFVERGWRNLVYVDSGVVQDFRAHERGQGFVNAAKATGIDARLLTAQSTFASPGDATLHPHSSTEASMHTGKLALQQCLQNPANSKPLALAFANDWLAAGAVLQARALGLRVPHDVAILGFGNFPISHYVGGGMSTVAVDGSLIGQVCAQTIGLWRELKTAPPDIHIPITPVVLARNSTK